MSGRTPRVVLLLLLSLRFDSATHAQSSSAIDHAVIDGVRITFGRVIEVEGPGLRDDSFGREFGAASLAALRIDGKPTQEKLECDLCVSGDADKPSYEQLRVIKDDAFYRVRGRLMNARFNGTKSLCTIKVERFESIPAKPLRLAEFVDRETTFDGTATPGGAFNRDSEVAAVEGLTAWPSAVSGKQIAIRGKIHRDANGLRVDHPTWKLIRLEDQQDQAVALEGHLWSLNDNWWFDYRGARLYLTTVAGPTMTFDVDDDHGRSVRVTGRLLLQDRPSLDQITRKSDRDLNPCFVVRGAKVEYLDRKTTWEERFGTVYPSFHTVRDGVPELLAEPSFRRNLWFNVTTAMLYTERNSQVIATTLQGATPKTLDVLAKRMNDATGVEPVRLLYAAMLASANDGRGRSFLLKMADPNGDKLNLDALYCLGVFPFLAPPAMRTKTEVGWAEGTMIDLMRNRRQVTVTGSVLKKDAVPVAIADAAAYYTAIPSVLMLNGSENSRQTLLDFALAGESHEHLVLRVVFSSKKPLPIDDLLKLEAITKDSSGRREILSQLLRHEHPQGIDRFLKDLQSGFVYMDFRDHLSPEVIAQLQPLVERATGESKAHLQMLLLLGQKDPVPALLALLADTKWTDKKLVLFELARLVDPRAVPVVAHVLRESPRNYFGRDPESKSGESAPAIEHGLGAIAHTGTAEAIHELVGLLDVDLARFGSYIDRAGYRRIVAAHLIELTGESFGIDAEAWRKWQSAHPNYSVRPELANPRSAFRTNAGDAIDLGN